MKKNPFYAFIWAILRPLILWLFPVEIQGRENLPDEPVVLCANHSSAWDPVLIVCALHDDVPLRIMAKQQLFRIPAVAASSGIWALSPWIGATATSAPSRPPSRA